jgi:hypothetical protein
MDYRDFGLDSFDLVLIEMQARIDARNALLIETPEAEWRSAELAIKQFDLAMRQLRAAERRLPALIGETGCAAEMAFVHRAVGRLTRDWRYLKGSWRRASPLSER